MTNKLSNEIKLKLDILFNKTGLDIELIEESALREDFYYYKLKLHQISLYVDTNSGFKFTEKFWYELKKIVNNEGLNIHFEPSKRAFAIVEKEFLTEGRYCGGMEYHDGVSENQLYKFLKETDERVIVFNDLSAISSLSKNKFRVFQSN